MLGTARIVRAATCCVTETKLRTRDWRMLDAGYVSVQLCGCSEHHYSNQIEHGYHGFACKQSNIPLLLKVRWHLMVWASANTPEDSIAACRDISRNCRPSLRHVRAGLNQFQTFSVVMCEVQDIARDSSLGVPIRTE